MLVVNALALALEGRRLLPAAIPALCRRGVDDRRVRRRKGQRVLQLRRRPQDAQRVRRQLLPRRGRTAVRSMMQILLVTPDQRSSRNETRLAVSHPLRLFAASEQ